MVWRRIAKAPKFPDRIACKRVVLRPFRYEDAEDLFGYANDEEWSRFITPAYPYQRNYADTFIEERINGHSNEWTGWCVALDDRMIGSIDLIVAPQHQSAELAYSLSRKHWNKGLMTEALTATIATVFDLKKPLNRLFVRIDTRNGRSIRLAGKLGFQKEGILRQNRFHKGQFIDEQILAILRDEHSQG